MTVLPNFRQVILPLSLFFQLVQPQIESFQYAKEVKRMNRDVKS